MASKEYIDFMRLYKKAHKCCPQCNSENYTTTLAAFILDLNNKDDYQDLNKCECTDCGDKHLAHDRVPKIKKNPNSLF